MLTEKELNSVRGLLHYLNASMHGEIVLDDSKFIASDGEPVALIGYHDGEYVLKAVYE